MDTENQNSENKQTNWKKELLEWVLMLVCTVAAVVVFNSFVVVNMKIPSGSMEDGVQVGDRIFANRLAYLKDEPERMDIIVFRYPDDRSKLYIKRIIGLPGETVNIVDGKVYINDSETPLDDSFIKEPMKGSYGPFEVPEGHYFVLGDNRNNSHDSRKWENKYVPEEDILGKAGFRYWPLNKIGFVK